MITIPGSIPITIHPIYWLIISALGWMSTNNIVYTIMWVGVATVSLIVHELGHALTAKFFGQRVHIELAGMGGLTRHRGAQMNSFKEFLVVLNGPLAGFLLFLLASFVLFFYSPVLPAIVSNIVQMTVWINFYWTIFNLMPVYPMDGGQLVRIILEAIFGLKGVKFSLFLSMVAGVALSLYFLSIQSIYIAALFLLFSYESYKAWHSAFQLSETDSKEDLQEELRQIQREIDLGDLENAKLKLLGIREKTKKGSIFLAATVFLGKVLLQQERFDEAYDLFSSAEKDLPPEGIALFQEVAYKKGDMKKAIALGNRAFQELPTMQIAMTNAFANAQLGDVRSTVGWIECARREGLSDLNEVIRRAEFNSVRSDPLFRRLVASVPVAESEGRE